MNEGGTQPFSATGYDQFGDALAPSPPSPGRHVAGPGGVDPPRACTPPPAGPGGPATVTATVTVTGGAVTGSAAVAVNHLPPAAADDQYSVSENGTLVVPAPGLLANDTDPEGQPLTAVKVAGPADGVLTLNADGSFTYTPAPHFWGTDTFTYIANDGDADSNTATVTIDVLRTPGIRGRPPSAGRRRCRPARPARPTRCDVVLASRPTADVTVPLASSDATVATVSLPSLTFTPAGLERAAER